MFLPGLPTCLLLFPVFPQVAGLVPGQQMENVFALLWEERLPMQLGVFCSLKLICETSRQKALEFMHVMEILDCDR